MLYAGVFVASYANVLLLAFNAPFVPQFVPRGPLWHTSPSTFFVHYGLYRHFSCQSHALHYDCCEHLSCLPCVEARLCETEGGVPPKYHPKMVARYHPEQGQHTATHNTASVADLGRNTAA